MKLETPKIPTEADPRWAAVVARDKSADGGFVYSVKIRPASIAGPPAQRGQANPRNVRFHAGRPRSEAAGFRACKRCRPNSRSSAERHARRSRPRPAGMIEAAEEPLTSDAAWPRAVGLSPLHFHRLFKAATGLTPKAYADAHRAGRVARGPGRAAGSGDRGHLRRRLQLRRPLL